MSDLPSLWPGKIQTQEQQFTAAVSEYTGQRLGQAVNYLKDTTDTNTSDIAALNASVPNIVKGSLNSGSQVGGGETLISSSTITVLAGSTVRAFIEFGSAAIVQSKSYISNSSGIGSGSGGFTPKRGSTVISTSGSSVGPGGSLLISNPCLEFVDTGLSAGSYTYNLYAVASGVTGGVMTTYFEDIRIVAEEKKFR